MAIAKNAAINLTGSVVSLLAFAALTPIYLRTIGYERYGVVTLVWAFTGFLSRFDLGIGTAVAFETSASPSDDRPHQSSLLWTGAAIALPSGLLFGVLLLILWLAATDLFKISAQIAIELQKSSWLIVAIGISMIMGSSATGLLHGRQRFLLVEVSNVTTQVLTILLPVVGTLLLGPRIEVIVGSTLIARLIGLSMLYGSCHIIVLHRQAPTVTRASFRKLIRYGSWASLGNMLEQLVASADRFAIGTMLGPQHLPIYVIPQSLASRVMILPGSLMSAVFPKLVTELQRKNARLIDESLRVIAALAPMLLLGIFLSEFALRIWLGAKFAITAAPIMRILLVAIWLEAVSMVLWYSILASGKPALNAKIACGVLAAFVVSLIVLIGRFGLLGAAMAYAIRSVAYLAARAIATGMLKLVLRTVILQSAFIACGAALIASWSILNVLFAYLMASLLACASALLAIRTLPAPVSKYYVNRA